MSTQPLGVIQEPTVLRRHDGVPLRAEQYDDIVALHKPSRHRAKSRGSRSICTYPSCDAPAVVDRAIRHTRAVQPIFKAHCHEHALLYATRVTPAMADIVMEMLAAPELTWSPGQD